MRKLVGILVCLFMVCQLHAVTYQTYKPCGGASFRSTSVYVAESQYTGFSNNQSPLAVRTAGSLSAISASNFESLNSEGGACYSPANSSATIHRVGRPGSGSGGIGVSEPQSPVGDTPWIIMAIMASLYVIWTKKRKKVKKNLVVS